MHRLYRDVRQMKRRSRDQKRSDLDFLTRNAVIHERMRSIGTEQRRLSSRGSWTRRVSNELSEPNKMDGEMPTSNRIGMLPGRDRLPTIDERGPLVEHRQPIVKETENKLVSLLDATSAHSTRVASF
ncbi:unnamed protein product [Echinostoma caproni]|uniref:Uncharacterized protein n=1 Tax=Echinostoma caproni TaxID=27848 RepID=A0A183BF66_9TREM|nr:unnamed protein product [Echinostoma caproni]